MDTYELIFVERENKPELTAEQLNAILLGLGFKHKDDSILINGYPAVIANLGDSFGLVINNKLVCYAML